MHINILLIYAMHWKYIEWKKSERQKVIAVHASNRIFAFTFWSFRLELKIYLSTKQSESHTVLITIQR